MRIARIVLAHVVTYALLALAVLSLPGRAFAQEEPCKTREQMAAGLAEQYRETVIAAGLSGVALVELYVSPAGTFTVTATGNNGCAMMIAGGSDWTDLELAQTLNPTRYRIIPGAREAGL